MEDKSVSLAKNKGFAAAVLASAVSIFAYETGFFFFLFLVPLQLLLFKRGQFWTRISALGVGIAIAYIGFKHTAGIEDIQVKNLLCLSEVLFPFLLLGGFVFVNGKNSEQQFFKRIIISTCIVGLICVGLKNVFSQQIFIDYCREQFSTVFNTLKTSLEANGNPQMIPIMSMDIDMILERVITIFSRGFLFTYFVILVMSFLFAQHMDRLSKRIFGISTEILIPDYFIWILIVALGIVLVDKYNSLGPAGYLGWNIFLIVMFLYGLRGMRIIRQIYATVKLPGFVKFCMVFCFVSLLLNPATSLWLLMGIPCIGIFEIWFKYKRT